MGGVGRNVPRRLLVASVAMALLLSSIPAAHAQALYGELNGYVTSLGAPVPGVTVYLHSVATGLKQQSTSGPTGYYWFRGVSPGEYILEFRAQPPLLSEFYPDARKEEDAQAVTVTAGRVTLIDVDLEVGGSISGAVTKGTFGGGAGPASAWVKAFDTTTGEMVAEVKRSSSTTSTYTIPVLPVGDYYVEFSNYFDDTKIYEYYNNAATTSTALPVHVDADAETTGIDAFLEYTGTISGNWSIAGEPQAGKEIEVTSLATGDRYYPRTDSNGNYTISGLDVGNYTVRFFSAWYNELHGTNYMIEWYHHKYFESRADPVPVRGGFTTAGVDGDPEIGGVICGTVTAGGVGHSSVPIRILDPITGECLDYTWSGGGGYYRTGPLPPGEYIVQFTQGWSDPFLGEYYEDVRELDEATPVTVTSGAETVVDAYLEDNTRVSGYVRCDLGDMSGVEIWAYSFVTEQWYYTTSAGGSYVFLGLPVGDCLIYFDPTDYNAANGTSYLPEYFRNVVDRGDATYVEDIEIVTTVLKQEVPGIDIYFGSETTCIYGSVSGYDWRTPLSGIDVYALDARTGAYDGHARSDATGHYSISGLQPGPHVILYDPTSYNELHETDFIGELHLNSHLPCYLEDGTWIWAIQGQSVLCGNASLERATNPPQAVYRFYNLTNGTHFFTPSADERDMVMARWPRVYRFEGVAYYTNPKHNTQPLYRFYNKNSGSHFYTASSDEAATILAKWPNVFTLDGQTYGVNPAPAENSIPVYRFYNMKNGSHFYTASVDEKNAVMTKWPDVYRFEGPAFWLGQ